LLPACGERNRVEGFPELVGARTPHIPGALLRSTPEILAYFVVAVADSTAEHRRTVGKPEGRLEQSRKRKVVRLATEAEASKEVDGVLALYELVPSFQVDVVTYFIEPHVLECSGRDTRARDRVDQVVDSNATSLWRVQLCDDLWCEHASASVPVIVAAQLCVARPSARHRIGVRALWMHAK
jgi:hypothetical protein